MESIKEAFLIDGITFSDLPKYQQEILEKTFEKLKEWVDVIISYEKGHTINIDTKNTSYSLYGTSDFPDDLRDIMLSAYVKSKQEHVRNSI